MTSSERPADRREVGSDEVLELFCAECGVVQPGRLYRHVFRGGWVGIVHCGDCGGITWTKDQWMILEDHGMISMFHVELSRDHGMSELLRQLDLLSYLSQRTGASVADLAAELGVSEPTVKRDVAMCRHYGADIISDRHVGLSLIHI